MRPIIWTLFLFLIYGSAQAEPSVLQGIEAHDDPTYAMDPQLEPRARLLANQIAQDFLDDRGGERTADAVENILKLATMELRHRGHFLEANRIKNEWLDHNRSLMLGLDHYGDLGDHSPLSQWLADVYNRIEAILGKPTCDFLHISDIKIINYGLVVVFRPQASQKWCSEQLAKFPSDTCKAEYARHFAGTKWVPNAGHDQYAGEWLHHGVEPVVGYWVAWGVCEGATFGMGALPFICSPIGTAVEWVSEKFVATRFSDLIYDKINK